MVHSCTMFYSTIDTMQLLQQQLPDQSLVNYFAVALEDFAVVPLVMAVTSDTNGYTCYTVGLNL